jgi:putative nucleotidyltransferase with HDIG domain
VNVTTISDSLGWQDAVPRVALAFLGGLVNAITVLILMPVFESVFNYLTPIKLLEFGSLNHPLLREMIVRAPGTYHHSHMVGTLAESASEAIGADSLFARVASYFHDIGKMVKVPYFIGTSPPPAAIALPACPSSERADYLIARQGRHQLARRTKFRSDHRHHPATSRHEAHHVFLQQGERAEDPEMRGLSALCHSGPAAGEAGIILLADTTEAASAR